MSYLMHHIANLADNKDLVMPIPIFNAIAAARSDGVNKLAILGLTFHPVKTDSLNDSLDINSRLHRRLEMGVRSLEGLPPEDHGKQLTAPDPDRAFNAILGRCVHWVNLPDRKTVCQSLTPDRLKS
ncbi:Enolase C-terminal domain-like [Parasponia andersonii]|uniref:Enolase C-terminal domain-like n=1 Tax=Parasponia andersonii TaxID=3476 RepID=A0A2P5E3X6_PARAD|nr:Enolase C-terminal domain-like [Parasponia andersonii]